jgi:diguanylate cyclase (GGDEF)-like protein/PAS domain S-box-containing protein
MKAKKCEGHKGGEYKFFEDFPEAVVILDTKGNVLYGNPKAEEIFGYTLKEVIGKNFRRFRIFDKKDLPRALKRFAQNLQGKSTEGKYTIKGRDGTKRTVLLTAVPLKEEGKVVKILYAIKDATEEEKAKDLRNSLFEIGREILSQENIDVILSHVAKAITTHSGFKRAAISLYDPKANPPVEGKVVRVFASGLSPQEERELKNLKKGIPPQFRKKAFSKEFKLGDSYYIPHDKVPWGPDVGIKGTISAEGWHPDDFLLIPLHGEKGIIGHISVDDPIDRSAPTRPMLEPIEMLANMAALAVEKAQRMEQISEHKERIRRSYRIGQELATTGDIDELADKALRILKNDFGYDYGSIFLKQGDLLKPIGEAWIDQEGPYLDVEKGIEVGRGIIGHVAQEGKAVLANDVSKVPYYIEGHPDIKSEIAIPIQTPEELLGVLDVQSKEKNSFAKEDQELLLSIAAQLAVAVSNIKRMEQLSEQKKKLKGLYQIGHDLSKFEDIDVLMKRTLEMLQEDFNYTYGTILLKEGDYVVFKSRISTIKKPIVPKHNRLKIGEEGIVGWVAANRKPALVNDVTTDPRYIEEYEKIKSELAVPIQLGEELIGVLDIETTEKDAFSEEDVELLESVAGQLGVAISNLRRKSELREMAIRDPLTGLYNRRYFNEVIETELERSKRYEHPFTLLMIDVDSLREINNKLGHLMGDEVLYEVAKILKENVRSSDMVFRYGGDEFLIVLVETDGCGMQTIARLKKAVEEWNSRWKNKLLGLKLRLSMGFSVWSPDDPKELREVLEEADKLMYMDKGSR